MNLVRPDLPKRLASRIRAAQAKVEQERYSVVSTEKNIANDEKRIREFETDREAFARKYCRNHAADSYPVSTTIARSRERLEYNVLRQPMRIERLAKAERALIAAEEEVLRAVKEMRPTMGRIPWPKPLPTMNRFRELREEADRR